MPIYLLIPFMAGLGYVAWKVKKPAGSMTARQRLIFQKLLSAHNPATSAPIFLEYAKIFDEEGFRHEAHILRKRARIASLGPAAIAKITMAYQNGLRGTDAVAVRNLANYMESEGFFGMAEGLRDYANHLDTGAALSQVAAMKQAQAARVIAHAPLTSVAHAIHEQERVSTVVTPSNAPPSASATHGLSDAQVLASATPQEIAAAKAKVEAQQAFSGSPNTPVAPQGAPPAAPPAPVPGAIEAPAGPPTGQMVGSIFSGEEQTRRKAKKNP
jgi:hypothetical protein